MSMQGQEWVTYCDKCKGPVRVAMTQAERAQTRSLYCERCFEAFPDDGDEAPPPLGMVPTAPLPTPTTPDAPRAITLEEARRLVREADEKNHAAEIAYVTCESCGGTGRVPLVLSSEG